MPISIPRGNAFVADTPTFRSPIASALDREPGAAITIADDSSLAKYVLRAAPDSAPAAELGASFGSSIDRDGTLIAAVRPDEWLLLGSESGVEEVVKSVPLDGHVTLVDLTHGRAAIRLTGAVATAALEKVCSLDWSDAMTPDGAATSASVAKVTCDVVRNDIAGVPSYLVLCDRSLGQYLYDALADAAAEFGVSGI